jgi:hypothetical protein
LAGHQLGLDAHHRLAVGQQISFQVPGEHPAVLYPPEPVLVLEFPGPPVGLLMTGLGGHHLQLSDLFAYRVHCHQGVGFLVDVGADEENHGTCLLFAWVVNGWAGQRTKLSGALAHSY